MFIRIEADEDDFCNSKVKVSVEVTSRLLVKT